MSLKAWANKKTSFDLTLDIVLGLVLFGLSIPLLAGLAEIRSPVQPLALNSSNASASTQQLVALRRAIIGQESDGGSHLVNPDSGAMGLGQLMPDNVREWGKEALGRSPSKQEFLNDSQLQLQIIDFKLNQYWLAAEAASSGNEEITVRMVASRWYSGRADLYNSSAPQYSNGRQYPSIAEYARSVLKRYRQQQSAAPST